MIFDPVAGGKNKSNTQIVLTFFFFSCGGLQNKTNVDCIWGGGLVNLIKCIQNEEL